MKLAFALPHTLELPAMTADWEFGVTGPQQAAMVKRADELGYDMGSVPEHFFVPHSHLILSGANYLHLHQGATNVRRQAVRRHVSGGHRQNRRGPRRGK